MMNKLTFIQRFLAFALAAVMLLSNSAYAFIGSHVCHEHCHQTDEQSQCCAAHGSHDVYDDVLQAFVDPHPHHCGCSDTHKEVPILDTEVLLALGQLLAPMPAQLPLLNVGERSEFLIHEAPLAYTLLRTGRDILTLIAVLII